MWAVGISCLPRPRVIDDPELKEQVEFVGSDPLSNDPVVVEMDDGQSPVWSRHRSWERANRPSKSRPIYVVNSVRSSKSHRSGRFQRHLLEARDLDDIAVLDIEGDAGNCPGPGVAAEDFIDALARDDEGAALPSTGSGDISARPQVLSNRPGSCIKAYSTMGRHERRRNWSEKDLTKVRNPNLVAA
jgi:hypothetical protein